MLLFYRIGCTQRKHRKRISFFANVRWLPLWNTLVYCIMLLMCSWPFSVMKMSFTQQFFTVLSVTPTFVSSVPRSPILHARWYATSGCLSQKSQKRTPSVCTTPCTWWSLPAWRRSARVHHWCATSVRTMGATRNTRYYVYIAARNKLRCFFLLYSNAELFGLIVYIDLLIHLCCHNDTEIHQAQKFCILSTIQLTGQHIWGTRQPHSQTALFRIALFIL